METNERDLRLTAVPRPGSNALPPVSALIAKYDWEVPELPLESGRLDEVFGALTQPGGASRAGASAASTEGAPA